MIKKKATKGAPKDITLRDVIVHINGMEQRLSARIDGNTNDIKSLAKRIDENTKGIAANSVAIKDLDIRLNQRIDALDEDLTATIKDTLKIRQHVGMALPG